jgi:mannose-1-phosphate guanylyltransferase
VEIKYIKTKNPMGTAGQLKTVESFIKDTFLCLYGDTVFKFNIKEAIKFHRKQKSIATIILMHYTTTLKYGLIKIDKKGHVKDWQEKPEVKGLINIGCYVMEPEFFKYIPKDKMFGMDRAFKLALENGERIHGHIVDGDFIDIGDRKAYNSAYENFLNKLGKIL